MDSAKKILAALAIVLSGCATSSPSTGRAPIDESLIAECPPLNPLADGDSRTVLRWALATVDQYNDCALGKKKLAEAVR